MEIPDYWAEARVRHRDHLRQVTVRRFGWSNVSLADAEALAQRRVALALEEILQGTKLPQRERKVPYNGAQGLPIREEVLARFGEYVITRNSYGAHCLNTPSLLFADIDFPSGMGCRTVVVLTASLILVGIIIAKFSGLPAAVTYVIVTGLLFATPLASRLWSWAEQWRGGPLRIARRRIDRFLDRHPEWNLRLYRTPNGLRLLATHRPFDPTSREVQEFFAWVHVDKTYQRMCQRQRCFRARLTAKPWRIGIDDPMRPRPGVWPVAAERLPARTAWIRNYESTAESYAACHLIGTVGSGTVDDSLREAIELHDQRSRALMPQLELA